MEIACNAVHFIDLISFLIKSDVKKIITKNLNKKWVKSERKGFLDVFGKLIIVYKNGVIFTLNTFEKKKNESRKKLFIKDYYKKK